MIHVVGLGLDPDSLPEDHTAVIEQATLLVGGKRQLDAFSDHPAERVVLASPLRPALDAIHAHLKGDNSVVVLADGDPLFFGIGNTLVREFGADKVLVFPNVTSVQVAASRLKIPWQNVRAVSLHGRSNLAPLFSALMRHTWVAVLTDSKSVPSAIAQALLDKGCDNYRMWIFEDLLRKHERVGSYSLEQASNSTFAKLNLVMLEKTGEAVQQLRLGIPDSDFAVSNSVITKWPVRAAGISALRLEPGNLVWDLGAGSGAMAVEMSSVLCQGRVVAVEKKAERIATVRENIRRFNALLVDAVHGSMPDCLSDLPDPDRIFIGGGISENPEILAQACDRLAPGGRMVIHCVLVETFAICQNHFAPLDWELDTTVLQAGISAPLGKGTQLKGLNPVFILGVDKPASP